jgi:hypothetical protein
MFKEWIQSVKQIFKVLTLLYMDTVNPKFLKEDSNTFSFNIAFSKMCHDFQGGCDLSGLASHSDFKISLV